MDYTTLAKYLVLVAAAVVAAAAAAASGKESIRMEMFQKARWMK